MSYSWPRRLLSTAGARGLCMLSDSPSSGTGFSRGGNSNPPPSKNRKPKPKPSAQKPSVRPTKQPKGFVAQATPPAILGVTAQNIDPYSPCGCGSGSEYSKCCGAQHMAIGITSNTPEQVLRARYTAFKYGIADYIIDSSHPSAEDYQKYMVEARASRRSGSERWKREILQLIEKEELIYVGLEIVSTEIKGDFADVIFRALFLEGSSSDTTEDVDEDFAAVEEKATFVRVSGKWLYQNGEQDAPDEEVAQRMIDAWKGRVEDVSSRDRVVSAKSQRRQAYLDSLPAVVPGKGGKTEGLVKGDANAPRAPWFGNTSKRKQGSAGLSDKANILPFPSGRA